MYSVRHRQNAFCLLRPRMNSHPEENKNIQSVPIHYMKRAFDAAISSLCLVVLSPIFLFVALLSWVEKIFIQESRGPLFYAETRMSQGNPFTLYKFRILKTSSYFPVRDRGDIISTKALERTPDTLTYTGKILRKFYLDELPQLWNVLQGDMSMVGTRPWTPPDYEKELAKKIYRKKIIKAGITGPVQIHKHNAKEMGGEHMLDNEYIEYQRAHKGLGIVFYDAKILLLSLWFMLKGQGL